jgi:2-polyprenyl-6-hydroxyphenyl methylase/3-demethylubiquinone-9 3-methyltransferase
MIVFNFGRNWQNFANNIDEELIKNAEQSLCTMLRVKNLEGLRFLDAGCGSGLFSLAAIRLGAKKVMSFDIDSDSVQCAQNLNEKYGPFTQWQITRGDVLDKNWVTSLGYYDVVYSWGVLHHTGDMWQALDNVVEAIKQKGILFVSIYNDQGWISHLWKKIKKIYNLSPTPLQFLIASTYFPLVIINRTVSGLIFHIPVTKWYKASERGMLLWYDCVDWCGGYPFETARPDQLFQFYRDKGFNLIEMKLKKGSGCNEFLFQNNSS